MDENKLYATMWRTVAAIIITLFLCITASCQNTKYTLKEMVKSGAHPMDASCALGVEGRMNDCLIREVKRQGD